MLASCELCPRRCGTNRAAGQTGFCGAGATAEVFRYGPHHGEEPPVSGAHGSGTVFFSRCTMRCIYCQNHPWSQEGRGTAYDTAGLAEILASTRADGCHNWNFVSPTPWLPMIREAIELACRTGTRLPTVYNTSGFERVETLREFRDIADIYLTDLRYAREDSASRGSATPGYVAAARQALLEMWRMAGPMRCDEHGVAIGGTICRILVLPGRQDEAIDSLRWLSDNVGTGISLSLMSQYVPLYKARNSEGWDRRPSRNEYMLVCEEADRLGFDEGWIQEYDGQTPDELVGCQMNEITASP